FPGHNLRRLIRTGELSSWWTVARILDLGYRVASGIQAASQAHGTGFVHNDLHPGNILVDSEAFGTSGWVKLIDFGLSSSSEFSALTASTTLDDLGVELAGEYRAPEVARGDLGKPRSDMYALGVILFQLLTHRFPRSQPDDNPNTLP